MPQRSTEDKDDVFIENLNCALFLLLGVLAVASSVILFCSSVVVALGNQQFSASLLTTPIFAVLLLVIGLGAVHFFHKRRQLRKKKTDALF